MGLLSAIYRSVFGAPRRRTVEMDSPGRRVHGRYDAAQDSSETVNIWASADALDADAANSLAVRKKLRQRSRYERSSNGHAAGIISTDCNYIIGTGPTLRMQTGSTGFNQMVEAAWLSWTQAVGLSRKLRTLRQAKTGDGEAFLLAFTNPALSDRVTLDVQPVECDRVTAPVMRSNDAQYVDGITFDAYGSPVSYDILDRHPGATWFQGAAQTHHTVPAKFVCHWFSADRPGQHRGVPAITPSLNLFATGRRYREAVLAAAETAADFAAFFETPLLTEEPDFVTPMSTWPINNRMATVIPAGMKAFQMRAEQPATTYDAFNRSMICEAARPLNMPYNIAACDSSGYSFSGGRLDHQTFFVSAWVERDDGELLVLNHVFPLWFAAAQAAYQWSVDAEPAPRHTWDWPAMPQIDDAKTATARKTALSCGATSLGRLYAEDGLDFEDEVAAMAIEYGVTVEVMRQKLFDSNFQKSGGAPAPPDGKKPPGEGPDDEDEDEDEGDAQASARSPRGRNGHIFGAMR